VPQLDSLAGVTLVQLRYFLAAANAGTMAGAAAQLHVAPSAIAQGLNSLEASLGTQLFVRRRSHGLTLTEAGAALAVDARAALDHVEEAIDGVRGLAHTARGMVRIACFVTLSPFVMPSILAALAASHPDLLVEVRELDHEGLMESLRTGESDLALGYDFGWSAGTRVEVVAHVAPHVLLAADHPAATEPGLALHRLAETPYVLLDLPRSREYFLGLFRDAGVEPNIRFRAASYEAVRSLVGRGLGYSLLNQVPATDRTYGGGRVMTVPLDPGATELSIVIASRGATRPTARSAALARSIRSHYRDV
jgi:Transcriptional regulator